MVLVASVNRYLLIMFHTLGLELGIQGGPRHRRQQPSHFTFCVSQYPAYFLLHGDAQEILVEWMKQS